ncbi:uncharacterized protein EV420DRAFT_1598017 [Desarmillaria tabescens]|uniref:Uncharacterized protein n=1 Tax=Armillaria tabescens TaxID=1929756 RepID=A0AA39MHI5_ARMTA|nr:uncharacterized protein EV420DRAFT_1598017 [Desarmillaria tabescens]KAK0434043.1 hypothetical protein EV420DRAFT_1598017 [Desarmillaria tabescens]
MLSSLSPSLPRILSLRVCGIVTMHSVRFFVVCVYVSYLSRFLLWILHKVLLTTLVLMGPVSLEVSRDFRGVQDVDKSRSLV